MCRHSDIEGCDTYADDTDSTKYEELQDRIFYEIVVFDDYRKRQGETKSSYNPYYYVSKKTFSYITDLFNTKLIACYS